MTRTRILLPILMMLTIAFISSPAGATPLPPGTSVTVIDPFTGSPGTLLASVSAPFVSALGVSDFSGTATESVYRDSVSGNMDFVYQFNNNTSSSKSIEQMSDASYGAFTTDVFTSIGPSFGLFTAGGVLPASANRSPTGGNIAWQYSGLTPGTTSAILMIKTNAPSFQAGTVGFINSGTVTMTGFLAPAPEPSFYGLLAVGLIGLIWASRRRKVSPTN
jgi:PEP-CTERM motif